MYPSMMAASDVDGDHEKEGDGLGVLMCDEGEEEVADVEIELTEDDPAFVHSSEVCIGASRTYTWSPVRIVENANGCPQSVAMTQSAFARERREVRDEPRSALGKEMQTDLNLA
ncbi:hypothetical protein FGB62_56g110 [Gracilaria domingensis]|nr:hypothetical protein FGB62_56g110 [Gracilaria domingensis]